MLSLSKYSEYRERGSVISTETHPRGTTIIHLGEKKHNQLLSLIFIIYCISLFLLSFSLLSSHFFFLYYILVILPSTSLLQLSSAFHLTKLALYYSKKTSSSQSSSILRELRRSSFASDQQAKRHFRPPVKFSALKNRPYRKDALLAPCLHPPKHSTRSIQKPHTSV